MIEELASLGVNEDEIPYFKLIVGNPELWDGINLHDYIGLSENLVTSRDTRILEVRERGQKLSTKKLLELFGLMRRDFSTLLQRESCAGGMSPFEILLMSEYLGIKKQKRTSGNITLHSTNPNFSISPGPLDDFGRFSGSGIVYEAALIDYLNLAGAEIKERILNSASIPRTLLDIYKAFPLKRNTTPFNRTLRLALMHSKTGLSFEDEDSMERAGIPREYYREYVKKYGSPEASYDANGKVEDVIFPVANSLGIKTWREQGE